MASEASKVQAEKQERDRDLIASIALAGASGIEDQLRKAPDALDVPAAVKAALDDLVDVLVHSAEASFQRARQRMFEGFFEALDKDPTLYHYVHENINDILSNSDRLPEGTALNLRAAWTEKAKDFVKTLIAYVMGKLAKAPTKDSKGILIGLGLLENVFLLASVIDTFTHDAYQEGLIWSGQNDPVHEILLGYEYVSMRDTRVRPRHRDEDGEFAYLDDAAKMKEFVRLLNDWGCRCTLVYHFRSAQEPSQN